MWYKIDSRQIAKYYCIGVIGLMLLTFLLLLYKSRMQSDDLGFIVYIEHHKGIWNFYQLCRDTCESNIWQLLVIFPGVYLAKYIPHFYIFLVIYFLFGASLFFFFKRLAVNQRVEPNLFELILLALFFLLYLVFTLWNRDTFQNAVFWLTGALSCMLTLALIISTLQSIEKKSVVLSFFLFMLVSNTRSNYILIFGLLIVLYLALNFKNEKKYLLYWVINATGFAIGFIYYISGEGLKKRLSSEGHGSTEQMSVLHIEDISSAISGMQRYITEPGYFLFFTLILFWIFSLYPRIKNLFFLSVNNLIILVGCLTIILFIHELFISWLLKTNSGYGRIYPFPQAIFLFLWMSICAWLFDLGKKITLRFNLIPYKSTMVLISGSFTLAIVVYIFNHHLKNDIFRANRLASEYDARYAIVEKYRDSLDVRCMVFNRFSNSGIIGFHDIPTTYGCDFYRRERWFCGGITDYDNWVFQKYLKVPFRLVTVDRLVTLPFNEGSVSYDIK
jgi:hypothetical protein